MRVLLTGAFGNVGSSALHALLAAGHQVRCFDLDTRHNLRAARALAGRAEVMWGDLRNPGQVAAAVEGQDVIIHLAFIIPKLSATGVDSESKPEWARSINVGGTRNLIKAAEAQPTPPKLVFSSSLHVYGRTEDLAPPRTVDDTPHPEEHYARHKLECEELIKASRLTWCIMRFAAVLPLSLRADPGMFDVPLDNRMEYVHTYDVGYALAQAVTNGQVWGKTLLIGGGPRCQYQFREIAETVLTAMGVGMLPDEAFGTTPFCTDWLDTSESQHLLGYQTRDLKDYAREMAALMGWRRYLIRAFRPIARQWLLRQSPSYRARHPRWRWLKPQTAAARS